MLSKNIYPCPYPWSLFTTFWVHFLKLFTSFPYKNAVCTCRKTILQELTSLLHKTSTTIGTRWEPPHSKQALLSCTSVLIWFCTRSLASDFPFYFQNGKKNNPSRLFLAQLKIINKNVMSYSRIIQRQE